jgi:hypothetical protein
MIMFSNEWEERYAQGRSHNPFPRTDLITYMSWYSGYKVGARILELGPGIGCNIVYFYTIGADYYGIEGSKTAVETIFKRFSTPWIKGRIIQGDFTEEIPFEGEFDIIVDRGSLTHNHTEDIVKCLKLVREKLNPSGIYIGIDWFSWIDRERLHGSPEKDEYTYSFESGKFHNCGNVHFSTKPHLLYLFNEAGLQIKVLDHKTIQNKIAQNDIEDYQATWNIVAVRKNA